MIFYFSPVQVPTEYDGLQPYRSRKLLPPRKQILTQHVAEAVRIDIRLETRFGHGRVE